MSFSIQILKTGGLVALTGGTIIASIVGGNWLANTISNRLDKFVDVEESKVNEQHDEQYEYKFIEEYQKRYQEMIEQDKNKSKDAEEVKKHLETKLNGTKIHEITPKGDVIMYYDTQLESFVYYCDDKNMPYKYLETVARKYSLDNDCLEIFINMYDELKKGIERQKDAKIKKCMEDAEKKRETEESDPAGIDVFASFKQYNKTNPKEMIKQRKYITKENANRYSYRGNIETGRQLRIENPKKKETSKYNTQDHQETSCQDTLYSTDYINTSMSGPPNSSSDRKKISFSDFKRMQTTTNVGSLPIKTIEEWVESDNDIASHINEETDNSPTFSPVQVAQSIKQKNKSEDASDMKEPSCIENMNETHEVTMSEEELADLLSE